MTEGTLNGVAALGIANLVVLLLAVSIRQQRKRQRSLHASLLTAVVVCVVHVSLQALALVIAQNFIPDTRALIGYAAVLAALPTAWCLFLVNDWVVFERMARAELEPPPEENPDTPNLEVARKYVAWGDYDNARRAYLAFAERHPRSAEPLLGLEGLYNAQGRYMDAARTSEKIVRNFGHDLVAWTTAATRLAHLYETRLNRPHEAEELRSEIVRRNPGVGGRAASSEESDTPLDEEALAASLQQARALAQRGSREAALAVLKRLRKSNSRDPRPLFESALILEADMQTDAARRTLETLVREFVANPTVWSEASFRLADFHANRFGNIEAARELVQRVADRSPLPEMRTAALERLAKIDNPWA